MEKNELLSVWLKMKKLQNGDMQSVLLAWMKNMNKIIEYKIDNKILKLLNSEGEEIITFNYPIRQVIIFHNCFIVRIEPYIGHIYNENVFGISKKGKILWQIENMSHAYKDSPYTGLYQDGKLAKLSNWDGTDLIIEPLTGKIIKKVIADKVY